MEHFSVDIIQQLSRSTGSHNDNGGNGSNGSNSSDNTTDGNTNDTNQHNISHIPHTPHTYLKQLKVLALNNCGLNSWQQVLLLSTCIPNIMELYLAGNDFNDIYEVVHGYNRGSGNNNSNISDNDTVFTALTPSEATPTTTTGTGMRVELNKCMVLDIAHCNINNWNTLLTALGNTLASTTTNTTNSSNSSNTTNTLLVPNLSDLLVDGNPIPNCLCQSSTVCVLKGLQRLSMSSSK